MRKVTETVVHAFLDGSTAEVRNTLTDGNCLWLHFNKIAWHGVHNGAEGIFLTLAGWNTPTTRDRLNGVLTVMGHKRVLDGDKVLGFYQEKHEPYIGHHTVGSKDRAALALSSSDVVFVAHPITAKGLAAVEILPHVPSF